MGFGRSVLMDSGVIVKHVTGWYGRLWGTHGNIATVDFVADYGGSFLWFKWLCPISEIFLVSDNAVPLPIQEALRFRFGSDYGEHRSQNQLRRHEEDDDRIRSFSSDYRDEGQRFL